MNFDLPTITALVQRLAAKLAPDWAVTCELARSVEDNAGALAMVFSTPERRMMHIVVAPHPPNESVEESVAHELAHGILSPLTSLIDYSPAVVMLEEQIVEHLGKLLATVPLGMARAISRAMANPRTKSAAIRKRISALATRRRNVERKRTMPDANKLAELAMKAGEMGGREDVPEDVRGLLQELVAALAGGNGAPESEPPMREEEPDPTKAPPMREEDMPEAMRVQYRQMRRTGAMMLQDTIRMRIHTARTVDKLDLDEATVADLAKAQSVEQFEREFAIVKRVASKGTDVQRKRSGVTADASDVNGAPSLEAMTAEGIPTQVAQHVRNEFARGKDFGNAALTSARKFRKAVPNG